MNKVCWIDVETTGLDKVKQDVIQIAGIIEIDNAVVDEFEFTCQPYNWGDIQQKALDVHGMSIEDLKSFEEPHLVKQQVEIILGRHVNKFDKKDKMIFAGYNSPFDYGFVEEWFKKSGDKYFNSYFYRGFGYHSQLIDVYPEFMKYVRATGVEVPNNKLVTAAAHFDIPLRAHDAMADIRATYKLAKIFDSFTKMAARISALPKAQREILMTTLDYLERGEEV